MPIFVFLLVFAGIYAMLNKFGLFGKETKGINAIIAFVLALIVVLSESVVNYITFVIPWFFILALILLFFIFIGKMFGKKDTDVAWAFSWGTRSPVITWVVIFVTLVIVIGFANIGGQELLEGNPEFTPGEANVNENNEDYVQSQTETSNPALAEGRINPASSDYSSNFLATMVHPKVLGMLILSVVALVTILLLTKSGFSPDK